ncbi:MAG: Cysteine desulfurase [Nitrosopumilales archaeon]|nr:MAG: Cysteine desulfurase [Nitrosopumilales archaeon]
MNSKHDVSVDFSGKEKIYLNNASVSLMPFSSIKAMTDFQISYSEIGPDSIESEDFIKEKLVGVRKAVAKIIKCQPEEVILTQSTTDGVNIVANGLLFNSNSNIVIRGMGHEHHANYFPWLRLKKKLTLKSLEIDENGFFELDELKNLVDNNTKLVALSHALYNTGAILPVEEIGEFLEKNNIPFFLDSAQTVGCIGDYDFKKTKCDFMAFNGSKWLCGPMGTGIFYCKKSSSDLLEPMTIGGESAIVYDKTKLAYKDIPEKFQTGFRNYVGIIGLEESMKYLMRFGLDNIHKKIINLANLLRDELTRISGITLYGPKDPEKRNSIVSFLIEGYEPQYVVEKLEKQKIVITVREIFEKKILRVSPHFFNSESEILKVVEAIKKL